MKRTHLHPLFLRLWHWFNAIVVITLLATGIHLRITGVPSLPLHSNSLLVHRYAGWAMAMTLILWLVYSIVSNHLGRHYKFRRHDIKGTIEQAKYYSWSIFRQHQNPFRPTPHAKFNPLQKIAYGTIMCVFSPALVITGFLFSEAMFIRKYVLLWDITKLVDGVHVLGAYVFALYLVVHVYMATLGRTPLSHIKSMIVGYEEEQDER